MASKRSIHAAAGGFKLRIKAPKPAGGTANTGGEPDGSHGSRASPSLSSPVDADTSQYLERVVDALNIRWSEFTRNEPSPWRSPTPQETFPHALQSSPHHASHTDQNDDRRNKPHKRPASQPPSSPTSLSNHGARSPSHHNDDDTPHRSKQQRLSPQDRPPMHLPASEHKPPAPAPPLPNGHVNPKGHRHKGNRQEQQNPSRPQSPTPVSASTHAETNPPNSRKPTSNHHSSTSPAQGRSSKEDKGRDSRDDNNNRSRLRIVQNGLPGGPERMSNGDCRDEEEEGLLQDSKRQRHSIRDTRSADLSDSPLSPFVPVHIPPSPPRMADRMLSPLSPHVIEPETVIPETRDVAVQAAEFRSRGVQANMETGMAWLVKPSDGEELPTYLSLGQAKLDKGPTEHPLISKVMTFQLTRDKATREKLLTDLRDNNQRIHKRARELKHKAEAEVKAKGNRWSIECVCMFMQGAIGFFECQEILALTRKDVTAPVNEYLNVAQLFSVASGHASRAERGESTGLVRQALHMLCQRMQALALMRFVYHSNRGLKLDSDKASAGLDACVGLSPDDSATSSQEVHSTETPTRPAGRIPHPGQPTANGLSKPGQAPSPAQNTATKRMIEAATSMVKSVELLARTATGCQDLAYQANRQLNEDLKLLPVLLAMLGADAGMSPHGLQPLQAARMALDTMTGLVNSKTN